MANNKDFIVKNPIEIGGSTSLTIGDADTSGTVGFKLGNASYDSVSFSVAAQDSTPQGIAFKSDGTKMFVVGGTGNDINEYSLSTAWDISTASYTRNFSVSSQTSSPFDIHFKPDGTSFFISDRATEDIFQYNMTTAWDLSTASYSNNSFAQSQSTNISGLTFNNTGTKMYIADIAGNAVYQYSLSTAFDVSTASYDSVYLSISEGDTTIFTMTFNDDGTKLFTLDNSEYVFQYNLTSAYDLSTASYSNISFNLTEDASTNIGIAFKDDGTKMYIVGGTSDVVYQYNTGGATATFDLSTGSYFTDTPNADVEYTFSNAGDVQAFQLEVTGNNAGFDISSASYESKTFSFSSQDIVPRQVYIRDNGLDMYMVGANNDNVFQYTLSTAWDISTASYASKTFSVSSEESNPSGISFKSDGTKMYISGATGDDISQYSLSTAWDITTASFDSVTAGSGQDTAVSGVFFKYDGTKFYMMGQTDHDINEFNMSTAWDISTASFSQKSSSIQSYEDTPWNLYFSTDGTKVFVTGTTGNEVNEFSLSTAWDISTLSHVRVFSVSSQDANPSGIFFKDDGTKMYITGFTNDSVFQYDTSTPITVTWNSTIEWAGGTAPTSPVNDEKDIYSFVTDDGGTSYIGNFTGNAFS